MNVNDRIRRRMRPYAVVYSRKYNRIRSCTVENTIVYGRLTSFYLTHELRLCFVVSYTTKHGRIRSYVSCDGESDSVIPDSTLDIREGYSKRLSYLYIPRRKKLSMLCPSEQQSGVTLFAAFLLEDFILVDFTVDEPIKKHLDV